MEDDRASAVARCENRENLHRKHTALFMHRRLEAARWPRHGPKHAHSRSNIIAAFTKTHASLTLGKSSSLRNYEKQALKMDSQVKTDVIMQQSINLFAHKHKTNCPKSKYRLA